MFLENYLMRCESICNSVYVLYVYLTAMNLYVNYSYKIYVVLYVHTYSNTCWCTHHHIQWDAHQDLSLEELNYQELLFDSQRLSETY